MTKVIEILLKRIGKILGWCASSNSISQTILRGFLALLVLSLIFFIFSVYGVVLLLFHRVATFLILLILGLSLGTIISTFFLKEVNQAVWNRVSFCNDILFLTFFCLFCAGGIFFFIPSNVGHYVFSGSTQLPLGDIEGMAVDSMGNIYLAIPIYQRIQVYDNKGNFLKGWFVDSHMGVFNIWIEEELLNVAISRTDKHVIMDFDGLIIHSSEIPSFEEWELLWKKSASRRRKDDLGNVYQFHKSSWFPKVTKTGSLKNQVVLISDPFCLWLLKAPIPVWMFGLFSMILIAITRLIRLGNECSLVSKKVSVSK